MENISRGRDPVYKMVEEDLGEYVYFADAEEQRQIDYRRIHGLMGQIMDLQQEIQSLRAQVGKMPVPDPKLEAYIAHVVGCAAGWRRGSGAHPPQLKQAIEELLAYIYGLPAPAQAQPK